MYTYFYFVLIKLWQMRFLQVSLLCHRRRDLRGPTLTVNPVAGKQQWLKIFVVDLDCALFFSPFSDDMANERQHPTHTQTLFESIKLTLVISLYILDSILVYGLLNCMLVIVINHCNQLRLRIIWLFNCILNQYIILIQTV